MPCDGPLPPVPDPIRGLGGSSFAYTSIVQRLPEIARQLLPEIARQMLAENEFRPQVLEAIEQLIQEIPAGRIRPLNGSGAPDAAEWSAYVTPYVSQNWLEVPWFFAETYFYRRILEATGYFRSEPDRRVDPFWHQKDRGLSSAVRLLGREKEPDSGSGLAGDQILASHFLLALWGNQADLSMWPGGDGPDAGTGGENQSSRILVDDRREVSAYLSALAERPVRVDFLMDNAGHELVADLRLAGYILASGLAEMVTLHLKNHPTFVSDAVVADVRHSVAVLAGGEGSAAEIGRQLQGYLDAGQLALTDHPFWTSPLAMWQMPAPLKDELAAADLLISKGDANYRRLLGDRRWPYTTPLADIICYLPAPLVALRTLKSEVAAGLRPGQPESLAQEDPAWLVDGLWGVIQFEGGLGGR